MTKTGDNEDLNDESLLPRSLINRIVGRFKCLWDLRSQGDCCLAVSCLESSSNQPKAVRQDNGKVMLVEAEGNPRASTTIMCHTAMLSAGSEYFMKRLQSGGANSSDDSGEPQLKYVDDQRHGVTYLREQLNEEIELPAFEAMIQFFYLTSIGPTLSMAELLKLLEVADRFAALECRAAAIHVLLVRLKKGLTDEDVNKICDFQPTNIEGWKAVEDMLHKCLMSTFGIAHATIQNPALLGRWRDLTWKAVRLILTSDELALDSEDAVAYLLMQWISKGRLMTDKQTELQVSKGDNIAVDIETNVLRYGLLTLPHFGAYLKENAVWLTLGPMHTHEIYRIIAAPNNSDVTWNYLNLPPLWFTRRQRALVPRKFSFTLEIDEMEFLAALPASGGGDPGRSFKSLFCERTYVKGYFFDLSVNLISSSVYIGIDATPAIAFEVVNIVHDGIFLNGNRVMSPTEILPSDQIYCIMDSSISGRRDLWPEGNFFQSGKMHIRVVVDGVY